MLLSEAHVFMDSRRFATKGNIAASYLFTQSRKRSVDIVWDSQKEHQVDKRLRDLTDYFYRVSRQNRWQPQRLDDGTLNPLFNKWAYVQVCEVIDDVEVVVQKFRFDITKAFPLYDTEMIIDPMAMDDD